MVQIKNFDAGIDMNAKAIPEDYIGSGGMRAAALAAIEDLISQLQRDGRLPRSPQQIRTHIDAPLSLRAIARAGDGPDIRNWVEIIQYEVDGLPPGEQAWIANFGGSNRPSWRILRAKNEIQSDWTGDYNSAEGALAVIQDEFE
jgi:hypothetical protein